MIPLEQDLLLNILKPLGLHVIRGLGHGTYMDVAGNTRVVDYTDVSATVDTDDVREVIPRLELKLRELKGDATAVYFLEGHVSQVLLTKVPPVPQTTITLKVAFARRADDHHPCFPEVQDFDSLVESQAPQSFGTAVEAIKAGYRACRQNWNGKNMFIYYVPASTFTVNRAPLASIFPEGKVISYRDHIDMYTAQGDCVAWVASQSDVTANDWIILPRKAEV